MTSSKSDKPAGLIYITGVAGTGKSSVRAELESRGYDAHEVDEGFGGFFHTETGKRSRRSIAERTPEWYEYHHWIFMKEPLEKLRKRAQNRLVFLCGTTWDEKNYWGVFDKVFALVLDDKTLEYRLKTRPAPEAWGKSPYELAEALARNKSSQNQDYRRLGATIIDATKPPDTIVDEILERIKL